MSPMTSRNGFRKHAAATATVATVAIVLAITSCRSWPTKSPGPIIPETLPAERVSKNFSLSATREVYVPNDLWKKINGAADLFLAYGFRELLAVSYERPGAKLPEIEVSIYEMGTALNAMGVYLAERSPGARRLEIGWEAYQTDMGLFFYKGPYYLKILDLSAEGNLAPVVLEVAAHIDDRIRVEQQSVPEMSVFPPDGLVPGSVLYVKNDALGHSFLKRVFKADYKVNGETATLFYCRQEDAADLLPKYREYGKEFGKIEREWREGNLTLLSILAFDNPELVFASGETFGGILGCPNQEKAMELIHALLGNVERILASK